jgi:hypothetical protein
MTVGLQETYVGERSDFTAIHERLYHSFFLQLSHDPSHTWRQRFDNLSARYLRRKTAAVLGVQIILQHYWGLWCSHVHRRRARHIASNVYSTGPTHGITRPHEVAEQQIDETSFWSNKLTEWVFGGATHPSDLEFSHIRDFPPDEIERLATNAAAVAGWDDRTAQPRFENGVVDTSAATAHVITHGEASVADSVPAQLAGLTADIHRLKEKLGIQSEMRPAQILKTPPSREMVDAYQLLGGCFQRWVQLVSAIRFLRIEYNHAILRFKAAIEHWKATTMKTYWQCWREHVNTMVAEVYHLDRVCHICFDSLREHKNTIFAIEHRDHAQLRHGFVAICSTAVIRKHIRRKGLHRAWGGWRKRTKELRRKSRRVNLVSAVFAEKLQLRAFVAWQSHFATQQLARRRLIRATNHWHGNMLMEAFAQFNQHTQNTIAMKRVLSYALHRRLATSFVSWGTAIRIRLQNEGKLLWAATKMGNQLTYTVLLAWKGHATDVARRRNRAHSVLQRIRLNYTYRIVNSWRHNAQILRLHARVFKLLTNKTKQHLMRTVLIAWGETVAEKKQHEHKVYIVLSKLVSNYSMVVLSAWAHTARTRSRRQKKMLQMLQKILHASISETFDAWRLAVQTVTRFRDKREWVLQIFFNQSMSAAFRGWNEAARTRIENRAKLFRVIRMMANASLTSAFNGWLSTVVAQVELHEKAAGVIRRLLNLQLGIMFTRWQQMVNAHIKQRRKKKKKHLHRMAVMKKAALLMLNMRISAAFHGWEETARTRIENKNILNRVIRLMTNARLTAAFNGWFENSAESAENRRKMTSVIKMMRNMQLKSAFLGWSSAAFKRADNRGTVERVLRMMLNALLKAAFEGWLDRNEEMIDSRAKMKKAALLMLNMRISAAFHGWEETARMRIENREKLSRVIRMMSNASAVASFNGWYTAVMTQVELRDKAAAVIRRMLNLQQSAIFDCWYERMVAMQEARQTLQETALSSNTARLLDKYFLEWHGAVQTQIREHAYTAAVSHWTQMAFAKMFNTWAQCLDEKAMKYEVASKYLARVLHRTAGSAFDGWCAYIQKQVDNRQKMQDRLTKLLQKELASAFGGWISRVDEIFEGREKMKKATLLMRNQRLFAAFFSWQVHVHTKLTNRRKLGRVVRRMHEKCVAGAFNSWCDACAKKASDRDKVKSVLTMMTNRALSAAVLGWCAYIQKQVDNRQKMQGRLTKLLQKELASAFGGWISRVDEIFEGREKMKKATLLMRNQRLFAAFYSWQTVKATKLTNRNKIAGMVRRMHDSILISALNGWQANTIRLLHQQHKLANFHRSLICRHAFEALIRGCHNWRDWYLKMTRASEFIVARIIKRLSRAAFASWAEYAYAKSCARERCATVAEAFVRQATQDKKYTIFINWSDWVYSRRRLRMLGERIEKVCDQRARATLLRLWRSRYLQKVLINTHRTLHLEGALQGWKAAHASAKHVQKLISSAVLQWYRSAMARSLAAWIAIVYSTHRLRQAIMSMKSRRYFCRWAMHLSAGLEVQNAKIAAALKLFSNRGLHTCFNKWNAGTSEQKELRRLCIRHLRRASYSRYFLRWNLWSYRAMSLRAIGGTVRETREDAFVRCHVAAWMGAYELQVARRAFLQTLAGRALARWRRGTNEQMRSQALLASSIACLGRLHVAQSFQVWRASTQYAQRTRAVLSLWLGRRVALVLHNHLKKWRRHTENLRTTGWKAMQLRRLVKQRYASRTWGGWRRLQQAQRFADDRYATRAAGMLRDWCAHANWSRSRRLGHSQMMARTRRRIQAAATAAWAEVTLSQAQQRASQQVARQWFDKRFMLHALKVWQFEMAKAKRARLIVRKSLLRRYSTVALRCLVVWKAWAVHAARTQSALGLWLGRRVAALLMCSLRRWRQAITERAVEDLREYLVVRHVDRRAAQHLQRVLLSWRRVAILAVEATTYSEQIRPYYFAWRRWYLKAMEQRPWWDHAVQRHRLHLLQRALRRWRGETLLARLRHPFGSLSHISSQTRGLPSTPARQYALARAPERSLEDLGASLAKLRASLENTANRNVSSMSSIAGSTISSSSIVPIV